MFPWKKSGLDNKVFHICPSAKFPAEKIHILKIHQHALCNVNLDNAPSRSCPESVI